MRPGHGTAGSLLPAAQPVSRLTQQAADLPHRRRRCRRLATGTHKTRRQATGPCEYKPENPRTGALPLHQAAPSPPGGPGRDQPAHPASPRNRRPGQRTELVRHIPGPRQSRTTSRRGQARPTRPRPNGAASAALTLTAGPPTKVRLHRSAADSQAAGDRPVQYVLGAARQSLLGLRVTARPLSPWTVRMAGRPGARPSGTTSRPCRGSVRVKTGISTPRSPTDPGTRRATRMYRRSCSPSWCTTTPRPSCDPRRHCARSTNQDHAARAAGCVRPA